MVVQHPELQRDREKPRKNSASRSGQTRASASGAGAFACKLNPSRFPQGSGQARQLPFRRLRDSPLVFRLLAFMKLLGQVILEADFTDGVELALQIIYVFFFVLEDL